MLHLLLALAASTAAVPATTPPAPPADPGAGAEIVVEGRRLSQHEVSEAVRAISASGADLPGCTPNAIIVVTSDPEGMIDKARKRIPTLVSGLDPAILSRIARSHDAVRSIASTYLSSGDSDPAVPSSYGLAGHNVVTLPQWQSSRLNAPTQTHIGRVTVIVDARQIAGLSYAQLSAYLAMATFAQLDVHSSRPNVDTILSLFPRGGTAPDDLTAFDRAYLRALYTVPLNLPDDQQRLIMIGTIQRIIDGLEKNKLLRAPVSQDADDAPATAQPKP